MLGSRTHLPRPARIILAIIAIYAFCWVKGWPRYYDDEELPLGNRHNAQTALGRHRLDHDQIIHSITTTANDVYAKVAPLILYLNEADKETILLFSDLRMEIGTWPVFDAIWRYPQEFIIETKELERYRNQIDYTRENRPVRLLMRKDPEAEAEAVAMLDKYKVLQVIAASWEYRPDRKWYVFTNAETYINRPNLMDWLSQFDPEEKKFIGNPPVIGVHDPFAEGGNSFILSLGAMRELCTAHKDFIRIWSSLIPGHASAFDVAINVIRSELQIEMNANWPQLSGFNPASVPFSPTLWCEPVLILHKIDAEIGSNLWQVSQDRQDNSQTHDPLRFSDIWDRFLKPEDLNEIRDDWNNLSDEPSNSRWNILFQGETEDPSRAPNGEESVQACKASCAKSEYCMQWSYSTIAQKNWNENPPTRCHLSSSVRFGASTAPRDVVVNGESKNLSWKSGWNKDRFTAWAYNQRCKAQHQ